MQLFVCDIPLCYDSVIYKICIGQNTYMFRQQSLFLNEQHGSNFSFFLKNCELENDVCRNVSLM